MGSFAAHSNAAPAGSDSSVKQLAQQGSKSCQVAVDMTHAVQGEEADKA
jgi:hypothetical protein